jgi:hypothetical protein
MPAQGGNQVLALELEKVRDKVPLLYERDDLFLKLIQTRGDVEKVSARNMRLPLQLVPGGKAGAFNPDGGDLKRGSGTVYDVAQVTPQFFKIGIEFTKLVEWATNNKEKAVENAVKREVKNAMAQFRAFLDKILQTAGNGVIGTISAVNGQVLTMVVPNGAALVYLGQDVQVYDTTITTNRGLFTVGAADPISTTQTITADPTTPLPAGTQATDVLVYDGLLGAQPTGIFGIPYHQNNAVTGTWLNLNRATYPQQLRTSRVNAGNAALTPGNVRLAYNLIRKSLGVDQVNGSGKNAKILAYGPVEQEHAWENLGITISQIIKEAGTGRANDLDLLFTGNKSMGGAPLKVSINASQTRVDFLDLSHWGRAEMVPIDYLNWGGQTNWPVYGNSGGLSAAELFYIGTAFQVWVDSPRSGAFIDTLARPSGY